MDSKGLKIEYENSARATTSTDCEYICRLPAPKKTPFIKRCFLELRTMQKRLIKRMYRYIFPLQNPYTKGEFTIEYWDTHRIVRVPRSFSLKFMGDIYNYETLQHAVTIKVYVYNSHEEVELKRDEYNRLWLYVCWEDGYDDRIEKVFDWVPDEKEADKRYKETGGGPHYCGQLPHFFASENYDLILHEEVNEPGNVKKEMREILKLNKKIVRERNKEKQ